MEVDCGAGEGAHRRGVKSMVRPAAAKISAMILSGDTSSNVRV